MDNSETIMTDTACGSDTTKMRERRQKRADIQIYRPGALRLLKKSSQNRENLNTDTSIQNVCVANTSVTFNKSPTSLSKEHLKTSVDVNNKNKSKSPNSNSQMNKNVPNGPNIVHKRDKIIPRNISIEEKILKKDTVKNLPSPRKSNEGVPSFTGNFTNERNKKGINDGENAKLEAEVKTELCKSKHIKDDQAPSIKKSNIEIGHGPLTSKMSTSTSPLSSKISNSTPMKKVSPRREQVPKIVTNLTAVSPSGVVNSKVVPIIATDKSPIKMKVVELINNHMPPVTTTSKNEPVNDINLSEQRQKKPIPIELTTKYEALNFEDVCTGSSDGNKSEISEGDASDEAVDPLMYVEFQDSFSRKVQQQKISKQRKAGNKLGKNDHSQNVRWADEKWSPAQKQRINRKQEICIQNSPNQRGIIQFKAPSPLTLNDSPLDLSIPQNTNQKILFNPSNPSRPVVVTSVARDLSSTWDTTSCAVYGGNKSEDSVANNNTAAEGKEPKLDPSLFYNIQKGEMDINYYVSSNQLPQEFRRIMDIRLHLQGCYRQLLISDIRLCQEKNLESALWKSLYYVIIEKLREYINRDPSLKDRSLSTLHVLVDEGQVYLQGLLTDLQQAYGFSLDAHLERDMTTLPSTKNRVKQAIHSCQKLLLSIGDLCRYKEQYNAHPNFAVAKSWYQRALQVQPRNGRPFNQLAIIAVSQKRPLDVVYYYVRSLSAANPFTSARDSLISMFDDIRKKYDTLEKKPPEEKKHHALQKLNLRHKKGDGSLRQEIWIRPDSGVTNKRTLSQSEPEEEFAARMGELAKLPTEQLLKVFLTSYLHCHGMLFSKVGLDHFSEVLAKTLDYFHALLKLSPPRMSPTYLLQIMTINMFAIDNTQLKDCRLENGYRSAAQDLALLLGQEMFARVAEAMVHHFPLNINYPPKLPASEVLPSSSPTDDEAALNLASASDSQRFFLSPLAVFVPATKVWCDWLLYQSLIWNPPPTSHDLPPGLDAWGVVAELATIVKGIGSPDVSLSEEGPAPHLQPVSLPEDKFLRGFSPVSSAHRASCYAPRNVSFERARDWQRIKQLQLCLCQFLCGVQPPILRLQKTDQGEILVPVVTGTPPDTPSVMRESVGNSDLELDDSDSDESLTIEDDFEDLELTAGDDDSPLASTVRLLAHRKKLLEKKQKQQRKLQALLDGSVTLEMEVRPRYLVPDTNCFIEHINIIQGLIDNTPYTLMVPLVVVNELEGLSKDAAVEKYGDANHAVRVREGAASALHYLNTHRNPSLKYVTSEGSVLPSSTFTEEVNFDQEWTNDDKILACCINFCSSSNKKTSMKEGMRRLYREVVLLTEDRNLRVKAYARDVPVRDLLDFAHWASIK